MLSIITSLLILQDRDQTILELQKDLGRIPLEIERAKAQMEKVDAALDQARKLLTDNELAIRKLEMDIKTRRESIQRLHLQRFETRKNEEYTAIGHEIESYEKQVRTLEDQELELMEQAEKLKVSLAEVQARHNTEKKDTEQAVEAFGKRKTAEEKQIADAMVEREQAAAGVTDELALTLYQRLSPRKFPPVVAMDAGDNCGGCHMKLTGSTASEVRLGKKITHCDHCGRIVYLP